MKILMFFHSHACSTHDSFIALWEAKEKESISDNSFVLLTNDFYVKMEPPLVIGRPSGAKSNFYGIFIGILYSLIGEIR
jgi:hypothetical protein